MYIHELGKERELIGDLVVVHCFSCQLSVISFQLCCARNVKLHTFFEIFCFLPLPVF